MLEPTTPPRTHAQRLAALEVANAIRSNRAILRRYLHRGEGARNYGLAKHIITTAGTPDLDVIIDGVELPVDVVDTMTIGQFLRSLAGWGNVKTANALRRNNISPSRRMARMTTRERVALIAELDALVERRTNRTEEPAA